MGGDDDAVSEGEKELICKAVEEGYFKVPRETSLVGLSDRLGMTDSEASEALRRALDQYLRSNLCEEGSP